MRYGFGVASTDPNAPLPLADAVRLIELFGPDHVPSVGALRERIRRGSVVGGKDASGRWTVTPFDLAVAGYLPATAIESQLAGQVPDSPEAWFSDVTLVDHDVPDHSGPDEGPPVEQPGVTAESEHDLYGGRRGTLERLYEDEGDLPFAAPPPSWVADDEVRPDPPSAVDAAALPTGARLSGQRPGFRKLTLGAATAVMVAVVAIAASTASSDEPVATVAPTVAVGLRATEDSFAGLAMNAAVRGGDYAAAIELAELRNDPAAAKRFRAAQSAEVSARRRAAARAAARTRAAERRRAAARRRAAKRRRAAAVDRAAAPAPQQAPSSAGVAPSASMPSAGALSPAPPPAQRSPERSPSPAAACEFPPC